MWNPKCRIHNHLIYSAIASNKDFVANFTIGTKMQKPLQKVEVQILYLVYCLYKINPPNYVRTPRTCIFLTRFQHTVQSPFSTCPSWCGFLNYLDIYNSKTHVQFRRSDNVRPKHLTSTNPSIDEQMQRTNRYIKQSYQCDWKISVVIISVCHTSTIHPL